MALVISKLEPTLQMRKIDKKIDKQLRLALTDVCEVALKEIDGFCWLTHLVNYSNFPKSLLIVGVFESKLQLYNFQNSENCNKLIVLINHKLSTLNIKLKNPIKHIKYDSEELCNLEHNGNWAKRLAQSY